MYFFYIIRGKICEYTTIFRNISCVGGNFTNMHETDTKKFSHSNHVVLSHVRFEPTIFGAVGSGV